MVSDDFFEFVELIERYTPNISESDFNAIYSFESFDVWADEIMFVRNKFRRSIFANCADNPNFKQHLVKIAVILQTYIREHNTIQYPSFLDKTEKYDSYKGKFFYDKYHNTLLNQVKLAYHTVKINMCDEIEMTEEYWIGTRKPYERQKGVKVIDKQQENTTTTIVPHEKTYRENYKEDILQHIYDYIIKVGYLDVDIPFENFKYCMSGKGTPTSGLVWKGDKDTLAYFIDTICVMSKTKWKKSEVVFGVYVENANMQNSTKPNPFEYLKKEIKNM